MKFQLTILPQCSALIVRKYPINYGYEIALTLGMIQPNGAMLRHRPGASR
jgi:hypothetical protein